MQAIFLRSKNIEDWTIKFLWNVSVISRKNTTKQFFLDILFWGKIVSKLIFSKRWIYKNRKQGAFLFFFADLSNHFFFCRYINIPNSTKRNLVFFLTKSYYLFFLSVMLIGIRLFSKYNSRIKWIEKSSTIEERSKVQLRINNLKKFYNQIWYSRRLFKVSIAWKDIGHCQ